MFEKFGATSDIERCRNSLRVVEPAAGNQSISDDLDPNGEFSGHEATSYAG